MKKYEQIRPISSILDRVLKTNGLFRPVQERALLFRWEEVVGSRISKEVQLVDVVDGVLFLSCKSASWKSEIRFQKKMIVEKSNRILGKPMIENIRFV